MKLAEKIKTHLKRNKIVSEYKTWDFKTEKLMKMPERKTTVKIYGDAFFSPHILDNSYGENSALMLQGEIGERTIKLEFFGKNLYSGECNSYYLKSNSLKEYGRHQERYLTTEWFRIDASQRYLNMTGDGFNRSVWQFCDADKKLIKIEEQKKVEKYRVINQKQYDHSSSKTIIPENAMWARVYFAKKDDEDCAPLGTQLQIAYGLIPEMIQPYIYQSVLVNTDKNTALIQIENKCLKQIDKEGNILREQECNISWDDIESVWVAGAEICEVAFAPNEVAREEENSKDKEYGIRWNTESSIPLCERIGASKNFHFNYMIGNGWAGNYPNDFDRIYPWNEMRVCAVKIESDGTRKICYEGETGFSRDGSAGEVMIEIPSYYTKREQKEGYEYLWITGTPKEGYELDPSFCTESGVNEHVYMSAYLGSENENMVHSQSNTFVTLRRSMQEYQSMIKDGYEAYDFLLHLTIQRLFLIETAILDSQSVFDGVVYLPYKVINTKTAYYALEDKKSTNEIIVKDTAITRRLLPGDCVTLLARWNQYQNTPEYQRMVLETVLIEDGKRCIRFSGKPIDVYKEKTAISGLPRKNGETDVLTYHTARGNNNQHYFPGHESFKYRGIENLWGGAWVNFGKCIVKNNQMYLDFPDGTKHVLGYQLPVQNVILTSKQFGAPTEMCVRRMGYDAKNPLLMLPAEIGNGASTNTYYCDAWYNIAEKDVEYLLSYGGAWDNLGYAGIFCYRANYGMNDKIPFIGVRLMLR